MMMIMIMTTATLCILILSIPIPYVNDTDFSLTFAKEKITKSNTNTNNISSTEETAKQVPTPCDGKDLLKCYFKMIFKISKLNPEEKTTDFKIHVSDNPSHIEDFVMTKKTMQRYLLPGNYRISVIFRGENQGDFCIGSGKVGNTITCNNISNSNAAPPPPSGPGTLHIFESAKFDNDSYVTKPPITVGTITVKGNNPHPSKFQLSSGDDEEGREIKIGPGKYSVNISLPKDWKLVDRRGNCTGNMTKGGYDYCSLAVQAAATAVQEVEQMNLDICMLLLPYPDSCH